MKTLIIYNKANGEVLFTQGGAKEIQDNVTINISAEIPEGKRLASIDISVIPHKLILEDIDTRVSDISSYLENADDVTVSKVEDTILETESNKILDGGM